MDTNHLCEDCCWVLDGPSTRNLVLHTAMVQRFRLMSGLSSDSSYCLITSILYRQIIFRHKLFMWLSPVPVVRTCRRCSWIFVDLGLMTKYYSHYHVYYPCWACWIMWWVHNICHSLLLWAAWPMVVTSLYRISFFTCQVSLVMNHAWQVTHDTWHMKNYILCNISLIPSNPIRTKGTEN
jgi:hypothetical protein